VWRVRWREGGQNRARVLSRKRDAEAFDAEIRRRKRAGELVESAGAQMTLAEFAREWWRLYGEQNLARSTLESYASMWDRHVLPRIGGLRLRELTPQVLEHFRGELAAAGVGLSAQRRSLVILQGMLQRAVEWGTSRRTRRGSCASSRGVAGMWSGRWHQRSSSSFAAICWPVTICAVRRSCRCSPMRACVRVRRWHSRLAMCVSGRSSSSAPSRWARSRRRRPGGCARCDCCLRWLPI
jgi:hypothetical protein